MSEKAAIIDDDEIDVAELLFALLSQWWIIAIASVVTTFIAIQYVNNVTPIYESSAKFAFEDNSRSFRDMGDLGGIASLVGLAGQVRNGGASATLEDRIRSWGFILSIADQAGLYEDTFFNPTPNEQGFIRFIRNAIGLSEHHSPTREFEQSQIIRNFNDFVSVVVHRNGIAEINTIHHSPERAAEITNIVVDRVLSDVLHSHVARSRAQIDYFAAELVEVQAGLEAAAEAIAHYAVENDLASVDELGRVSAQLVLLRDQREMIQDVKAAFIDFMRHSGTGAYISDDVRSGLLERHPIMLSAEFRRLLGWSAAPAQWSFPSPEIEQNILSDLDARFEDIQRTIQRFEAVARRNAESASELAVLERERRVQEAIYESIVSQFEALRISDGFQGAVADIFHTAVPPLVPRSPNKIRVVGMGLFIGLIFGVGIALIRNARRGILYTKRSISGAVRIACAASGASRYFRSAGATFSKQTDYFRAHPHSELDELAIELKSMSSNVILVAPVSSSKLAGRLGLYFSMVDSDQSNAILDLSRTLPVEGAVSKDRKVEITRTELADGPTIITRTSDAKLTGTDAKRLLKEAKQEFDHIIVVCPALKEGTSIAAAVLPDVHRIVFLVRPGAITKAMATRIRSWIENTPDAPAALVYE